MMCKGVYYYIVKKVELIFVLQADDKDFVAKILHSRIFIDSVVCISAQDQLDLTSSSMFTVITVIPDCLLCNL